MNIKSTPLSNLVVCGAISLIAASIFAAAFNLQIPIWLAVLVGAGIGFPFLVIGLRLHPGAKRTSRGYSETSNQAPLEANAPTGFWPTRSETWGMIGLMTFAATLLAPCIFFLPMFFLIPGGDKWPNVILRILLAITAVGFSYWWLEFSKRTFPKLFHGRLSDETIDSFVRTQPAKRPNSALEALIQNWQLLLFAALAFLVAYWVLNFNNPGPILNGGNRRVRGVVRLLEWCRDNPNTVVSSSILIGIGALTLFVYHIIRAYVYSAKVAAQNACNNPIDRSGGSAAS